MPTKQKQLNVWTLLFLAWSLILIGLFVTWCYMILQDAGTGCGKTESLVPCKEFAGLVMANQVALGTTVFLAVGRMITRHIRKKEGRR